MKPILIPNFVGTNPVAVDHYTSPDLGPLVTVRQHAMGLDFQHSMTVTQARDMAEALLTAADELDRVPA